MLVRQISHWTPARWRGHADAVRALVQVLADAGADAEGLPRRGVPTLPDTALADQVRVLAADLMAAHPPPDVLERVEADVTALRHALRDS
nr:hypothetical protein [Allocatelliglobosispora scoriae]